MNEVINADALFEAVFQEDEELEVPFDVKDTVRIKKEFLKNYKHIKELKTKKDKKMVCKNGRVVDRDFQGNIQVDFWSSTPARVVVPFSDLELVEKFEEEAIPIKVTASENSVGSTEADAKPTRYNQGSIEVWDAVEGMGLPYLEGNIVKYIARYKQKNGTVDLHKALNYLIKIIANHTDVDYYGLRNKKISEIVGE